MQLIGTEVLRNHFSQDIWLNSLEYRIRRNNETNCVVISDARFRNELDLIKSMGGVIIWVQRGELPEWFDTAKTAYNNAISRKIMETKYRDVHESEWNWAGYPVDFTIKNDGTLEELQDKVQIISKEILNKRLKIV